METKIICISGKARHGKDTFAEILKDELETNGAKNVRIEKYGDLVKFIVTKWCDWDGKKDETGRSLLQRIGTDIVRKQNPDYWVNFVVEVAKLLSDTEWACEYLLIPDTRFPNEIVGRHVRIVRDDFDNNLNEEQKNHPSETSLDNIEPDFIIHNNGSKEELKEYVHIYLKDIIGE